jgi:P-type E1-E2 ATPase
MDELGLKMPPSLHSKIESFDSQFPAWVMIGWDQQIRGAFMINEQVRPAATSMLAELQSMALHVMVLSGDRQERAKQFSSWIDIPVLGGLLPHDKVAVIHSVRQRAAGVVMVGDGINDAAALASADVGIALGCGSDISREAADVCLLGNDLTRIPWLIQLARKTVRVIRQNLFWSFAYNTIGIVMAISGTLNPIWAAAAMMFSSFFVVANSLRLGGAEQNPAIESVSPARRPAHPSVPDRGIPSPAVSPPQAPELIRAN